LTPRYGDLDTLRPYVYRPKHRTRRNGEHNRTSGNDSTWRADTQAALNGDYDANGIPSIQIVNDAGTQLVDQAALERWVNRVVPNVLGVSLQPDRTFSKINQAQDTDHAPIGFDADIPY
jgi:hypothetical protein